MRPIRFTQILGKLSTLKGKILGSDDDDLLFLGVHHHDVI